MSKELKIAETIDQLLPSSDRHISHGTAVCAMILNGLGFVNQRLYLIPQFFQLVHHLSTLLDFLQHFIKLLKTLLRFDT